MVISHLIHNRPEWNSCFINPFTPRVSYGDIKVILTFESVDEIPWSDHSNETSSTGLSHGTIYKMQFTIHLEF